MIFLALLPLLALSSGSVAPPAALPQEDRQREDAALEERLQEAEAHLMRTALELAQQASEIDFHTAARGLFEFVIELDPENGPARKGLGMRKRDGAWQSRTSRPKKDKVDEEDLQPFLRARASLLESSIERIDIAFGELEPTPARIERRRRALDPLNSIDPDDAELRARTGYAQEPDTLAWKPREVVEARRRMEENARLLSEIRSALPATSSAEPDDQAAKTSVGFANVIASKDLHVAATVAGDEAQRMHDLVLTQLRYLERGFDLTPRIHLPTSVISLSDSSQKQAFFSQHARVKESKLEQHLSLYGSWIGQQVILSSPTPEERLDMGTFLTASAFLGQHFGQGGDSGWVKQSLASYLSSTVCGTHLSFIVTRDVYGQSGPPWPSRVPPSLDGWLRSARPLLAEDKPLSSFVRALTVPTRTMTWEDVVVGYAFAAYLYEGRRDDLVEILRRLARGEEKLTVLESVLEMPAPAIRGRLADWIDQVGGSG